MNNIEDLVFLCKYAGQRHDFVQAGGGNASIKIGNSLYIKGSGVNLSEVGIDRNHVEIVLSEVADLFSSPELVNEPNPQFRENYAFDVIERASLFPEMRPSIEVYFHIFLDKFVLHTHPTYVNAISCKKNWKERLLSEFPNALCVEYIKPGIELAVELHKSLGQNHNIIFLQNHGLIVHSDTLEQTIGLHENVMNVLQNNYFEKDVKLGYAFELSSYLLRMNIKDKVVYPVSELAEVDYSNFVQKFWPVFPDMAIYLGMEIIEFSFDTFHDKYHAYIKKWNSPPILLFYKDGIFVLSDSLKKAREIVDVFNQYYFILNRSGVDELNYLTEVQVIELLNWDSEIYRRQIK